MFLQISLLRVNGIDASIGALLNRKYVDYSDDITPMDEVLSFLKDNAKEYFTNEKLINNISSAESLSSIDLQCLRYMMFNDNLDIMVRMVDLNAEPKEEETELVITNYNQYINGVPYAYNEVLPTDDLDVDSVFRKCDEVFKLFDGKVFEGVKDPFISVVDNIVPVEVMMDGQIPESLTNYCTSILSYIGVELFRVVK